MVYGNCPMFGGSNISFFYLNWIIIAVIFALIFWGAYYLLIKSRIGKEKNKK